MCKVYMMHLSIHICWVNYTASWNFSLGDILVLCFQTRSRIHERTISLRFLGIILGVLILEVSVNNVTLQTSFKPLLLRGGGGGVKIR
jgi:hypothetical protein